MTAWSTTNKHSSITLSNSNLTATKSGTSDSTVIADTGYSSGKRVFAVTHNSTSGGDAIAVALATHDTSLWAGDGTASLSITNEVGILFNGNDYGEPADVYTGAKFYIAINFDTKRLWWKEGATGDWFPYVGDNPDAGIGGFDLSVMSSGALYPAASMYNTGRSLTLDPLAEGHGLTTFLGWDEEESTPGTETQMLGDALAASSFVGSSSVVSVISSTGVTSTSFVGRANKPSVLSSSSSTSLSLNGSASITSVLSASGSSAVTINAQSTVAAAMTALGQTVTALTGNANVLAVMAPAGASASSLNGASQAGTVMESDGTSAATFIGPNPSTEGEIAINAGATVTLNTTSTAVSVFSIGSSGATSFVGSATSGSRMTSSGLGYMSIERLSTAVSTASFSGTSTANLLTSSSAPSIMAATGSTSTSLDGGSLAETFFDITSLGSVIFNTEVSSYSLFDMKGTTVVVFHAYTEGGGDGEDGLHSSEDDLKIGVSL